MSVTYDTRVILKVLGQILINQGVIMTDLDDTKAAQAKEAADQAILDGDVKAAITAGVSASAALKGQIADLKAQVAALQAGGAATPADLQAITAGLDATDVSVNALDTVVKTAAANL